MPLEGVGRKGEEGGGLGQGEGELTGKSWQKMGSWQVCSSQSSEGNEPISGAPIIHSK
jgi:hypothetical protein